MKILGKICMAIVGVFMIIMGIAALVSPAETFVAMSWLWAIMTLIGGIALIVVFFMAKDMPGRGLLLFAGIVQGLLGFVLLNSGAMFTTVVALNMLQLLIIFTGVSGIVGCFELKRAGVKMWWLDLILGILLLLIGLSSASSAVLNMSLTAVAVGMGLILCGIGFIAKLFQNKKA